MGKYEPTDLAKRAPKLLSNSKYFRTPGGWGGAYILANGEYPEHKDAAEIEAYFDFNQKATKGRGAIAKLTDEWVNANSGDDAAKEAKGKAARLKEAEKAKAEAKKLREAKERAESQA